MYQKWRFTGIRVLIAKIKELVNYRLMSVQAQVKQFQNELESPLAKEVDTEWTKARSYEKIPGPRKWPFVLSFLPGGSMYKLDPVEMQVKLREKYGDIYRIQGSLGSKDAVFTYNVDDVEKVMRTDGPHPYRFPIATMDYYRKELRPDVFHGRAGLITDQGEMWSSTRSKVNPILLKPQTIRHHLPGLDKVSKEFIKRIDKIRDPQTLEVPGNFEKEMKKWAVESICSVALDRHLGLLSSDHPNPLVVKLQNAMDTLLQLSFEIDMLPPIWKYYRSSKFNKLLEVHGIVTDITLHYINETMDKLNERGSEGTQSALEQLLKVDKTIAIITAIDMLMAGGETTVSAAITLLYQLAKNPDKQEKLRKEVFQVLPEKEGPLTIENTKHMPYLRACIKEALRIKSTIPIYSRKSGKDLVISGFQVPKGTFVMMNFDATCRNEKYFTDSEKYLPERWLKETKTNICPNARAANPFSHIPFGFGPRMCVGKRIAEMEIESLMVRIIRNYKVCWNYADMQYVCNLINYPISELSFKFEDVKL